MTIQTHMLWVYGDLSQLELICANSFISSGFELNIWTYSDSINAPKGAIVRDAREILSESRIFKYKNGSYSGFSNLFRYSILSQKGGLWADMDVICLTSPDKLGDQPFLVSERQPKNRIGVNTNVIFNPRPEKGDFISMAYAFTDSFPVNKLKWGDCGPRLFSMLAKYYPDISYTIRNPNFANPFDYWDCPKKLLEPNVLMPIGAQFIHCYAEMWRRGGYDRDMVYPNDSIMSAMSLRYL